MKNVFTATGMDGLNEIMRGVDNLHIIDIDIQRQEVLWEQLKKDEFKNADVLLVIDNLAGPFTKEEMIRDIRNIFKGDIYIIIDEYDESFNKLLRELKITNIYMTDDDPEDLINAISYNYENKIKEEDPDAAEEAPKEKIEKVYIKKTSISFIGTGGSGKTSVAIDIANRISKEKYDVCIVDLNFSKSDIAHVCGVDATKGFEGIINADYSEKDVLSNIVSKKDIYYFTGLRKIVEMDTAEKRVQGVINVLKKHFDVLIMDTGDIAQMSTHWAIELSDHQVIVTDTAETSIKAIQRYLNLYKNELNSDMKAVVFLNKVIENGVSVSEMKKLFDIPVIGNIPWEKKIAISIEKGKGFDRKKDIQQLNILKTSLFDAKQKKSLFNLRRRLGV